MRRNSRINWFFCIALLFVGAIDVRAIEITGLYDAQVEVVDRGSKTFRRATQDALAEVIVRVSGDSNAIDSPDVISALSNPDRYLLQFGYEKLPPPDQPFLVTDTFADGPDITLFPLDVIKANLMAAGEEVLPELLLKLQFDDKAVNQLLRRAGLPIWASNRPELLLWLGAEHEGQRQLVGPSSAQGLNALLMEASQRRGLPLTMPIYDLQDQALVTIGDIWGMFTDRLIEASDRYSPTGVLVGKLYQNSEDQWLGSWTLNVGETSEWLDAKGDTEAEVITLAIDWATDLMAAQFAIVASADDTDSVILEISGVSRLASYANISRYLDGLVAIRQVQMQAIQGDVLTFQVYLQSDKAQLQQSLQLDGRLALQGEREGVLITKPHIPAILTEDEDEDEDDQERGEFAVEALDVDARDVDSRDVAQDNVEPENMESPIQDLSQDALPQSIPEQGVPVGLPSPILLYRWNG